MMRMRNLLLVFIVLAMNYNQGTAQCADPSNVYAFVYNGNTYEIIKENKTWIDAAACAVERGGYLTEINDASEQDAIYFELNTNANIDVNNTIAPDGGGGSYVWLGANDLQEEGAWMWDGHHDNNGVQFWQGTTSGNPVGGLYSNWGNEPDNWNGQDALAISLNGWPLGLASQWNDVDHTNELYFVVEYSGLVGFEEMNSSKINVYPNPAKDEICIENKSEINITGIIIIDLLGKENIRLPITNSNKQTIDISELNEGIYFVNFIDNNKQIASKKIAIE